MIYKIRSLLTFVKRFCYYGYHGAKYTYDFDASGIHTLIHAHISRVNDFMHDPNSTHLLWNSNPQNRDMKLLREFTELSRRLSDKYDVGYNWNQVYNKYSNDRGRFIDRINDPEYRKESRIARKKDEMIKRGLEDRYYYLLRNKVQTWWD